MRNFVFHMAPRQEEFLNLETNIIYIYIYFNTTRYAKMKAKCSIQRQSKRGYNLNGMVTEEEKQKDVAKDTNSPENLQNNKEKERNINCCSVLIRC